MIKGKPQITYGGGQISAPKAARQRGGAGLNGGLGASFASYLPKGNGAQGQTPVSASRLPSGQYAFQAQNFPQAQNRSADLSLGLTANQVRNQAALQSKNNNPMGFRSLSEARSQGNSMARSMAGMSNVGGMLQQPQTRADKSAPRISGRPVTGRGEIGMEDTRRKGNGARSANRGRPASQAEVLAASSPPESLGIMRPGRSRLDAMGRDPYTSFAARFQPPGLHQSFVAQGFASPNAKAVLQSQGYDLNPAKKVRTKAQLLPAPLPTPAKTAAPRQKENKVALPTEKYPKPSLVPSFYSMANNDLGSLAAKFESGEEGIAAIGYDRKGGTSYGKYQISSRAGTMSSFISYLNDQAPDLAKRLAAAGPANTGGRRGKMPQVWRQIAAEDPQRFERLQSEFIRTSHFEPAIQGIAESTGLSFSKMPKALQEVLFSTAVQHGPAGAVRIVTRAVNNLGDKHVHKLGANGGGTEANAGRKLIQNIYNLRAGQFVSSTARVRGAVQQRLNTEMREALQMLS